METLDTFICKERDQEPSIENPNTLMFQANKTPIAPKNNFKSINSYKPTGNLIYNQDLLKNIENKSKK